MLPKILVAAETGPKGQNRPKNWVFRKYLKNSSLDFFDFVHDFGPLYVFLSYIYGMLLKITLSASRNGTERSKSARQIGFFGKYLKNSSLDFFDFVHDIGPLYVFLSYICGMLLKILVAAE